MTSRPSLFAGDDRRWRLGLLVLATVIAVVSAAVPGGTTLISLLVTPSLIAAVRGSWRTTAIVAAFSFLLALVLGVPHSMFGSLSHMVRVGVVAVGGGIAVILAGIRQGLEGARFRYSLIADAGLVLASALDWEIALIELARLCSRRLADWCFVFIVREDGKIRQLAAAHVDPDRQRLAWELLFHYPLDPNRPEGPAKVIRTGRSDLQPAVEDSLLEVIAADDENLRMLRALRLRSAMIVPLTVRDATIGAIAFASAESGRVYGPADLTLAEELAGRAAIAVDNARLYDRLRRAESELRQSRDQLRGILDGVADAVTAQDQAGRIVYANDAAARELGLDSAEEMIGRRLRDLRARWEIWDEQGREFPLERLPGLMALSGARPDPALIRYRRIGTSEHRWAVIKATPILDEGRPVLAISVIEDVTEQREREQEQRFLADSSKLLAGSLDVDETFPEVAGLVVRELADWCVIEAFDDEADGARTVANEHRDTARRELARRILSRHPAAPIWRPDLRQALLEGRSLCRPEVTSEDLAGFARDPEHLALLLQLGVGSAITAPLRVRGETFGALTMASAPASRHFDQDDVVLAEELAGRCALALDNARLFRERSDIARTLQESLLPPLLPELPGLDVAARFRAAGRGIDVGGDFYDLFDTGRTGWAVAIGDVCGKGTEAAAITALARYTVRAATMRQDGPSQILSLLNEALLRQRTDRRFCTVLYGRLSRNGAGAAFEFASGGHPLPLVLGARDGAHEVGEPGTLLGIVPDPTLVDSRIGLRPGDALVLYTDGVTDAAAPDRVRTPAELGEAVGSVAGLDADAIAERMMSAALDAVDGEPRDDIAILVLKVPEPNGR